jgi:hypothetical protein
MGGGVGCRADRERVQNILQAEQRIFIVRRGLPIKEAAEFTNRIQLFD